MSISDQEAAEAWKKAQGQVNSKSDMAHFRPALYVFAIATVALFALLQFVWNKEAPIYENALFAAFGAALGAARVAISRRYRR